MGSPPLISSTPKKNVLDGSNSQHVQLKLKRDEINHDGDTPLKRLKRDECDVDETTPLEKPYGESRFVGDPRVVLQKRARLIYYKINIAGVNTVKN